MFEFWLNLFLDLMVGAGFTAAAWWANVARGEQPKLGD